MRAAIFAQNMFPPWIEGIKNNSWLLSRELVKKIDIEVISHGKNGLPNTQVIDEFTVNYLLKNSDNKPLQIWYYFVGAFKALKFIKNNNISIIAFQYLEISFILPMFFLAFLRPKTNFILTLYSTDELEHWYKKLTIRLLKFKIKKVIIISEFLRDRVLSFGYRNEDIVYIPLSYDKNRYLFQGEFSKREKNLILFSAGPIYEAGSFFMVDLAKEMPEYKFLFTMRQFNKRSEDEIEVLQKYISEAGVKNIEILRNVDNMEEILSRVGALVLPLQDIHIKMLIPVALLEAMARGTICFVSDLPNLKRLVSDGENAIVFNKDNIGELREKIRKYISNENISKKAYEFGKNFPGYPEIAQQYYQVIQEVAGGSM